MIYVGIDVAKDKHDCFITDSDGEILFPVFTIQNNRDGFDDLFAKILSISSDFSNIKVGLEATGHYSYIYGTFIYIYIFFYYFNNFLFH